MPRMIRRARMSAVRFRPEEREEDDVADRRRVREHHREPIDAHAEPRRRRHAVLERAHVIFVVVHRFFVAALLLRDLCAEAAGLVVRIVQLGEGVAELAAMHEQLEAIDELAGLGEGGEGVTIVYLKG